MRTSMTRPFIPQRSSSGLVTALGQVLVTVLIGAALFVVLASALPWAYSRAYAGHIFPGVSVGGVDVSNLEPAEAAAVIATEKDYPETGKVVFFEADNVWIAKPRDVGLFVDAEAGAQAAYVYGRDGGLLKRLQDQFNAWSYGVDLPVLLVYDERMALTYLQTIANEIDLPIIEATIGLNGVDVVVNSGQIGRKLDIQAALDVMRPLLNNQVDSSIPLVVHETPPVILDASQQAEIARKILSAPLVIQVPDKQEGDPGPWTFEPAALAALLVIERVENEQGALYQVSINTDYLLSFLDGIASSFTVSPVNARFIFNDDTRQLELIQPAVIGRRLDVEASLNSIKHAVTQGDHSANLVIAAVDPQVKDDSTGQSLGITELVSSSTSYFYGSSASRIQNIQTAAARFHGLLIPPGATFSMGDALGDVSLDTGYEEAWIIFGDRTIKGVGGGVCQVSTTLFRTVFFGGYPVVERYPHAYRVGYYEQTASGGYDKNLAGLDATVYMPVVDFRFTNDTPYWLLMETYVNASAKRLLWKFYSTSDGRSVDWGTTGPQNIVEPPDPLYEENSSLSKDEIKQVDWAAQGADIVVNRTVMRDGAVLFQDEFRTHYLPWRAVYQYGPGTEIPTPVPKE
jgi:vancomycin resistance protein YoaR